MFNPTAIDIDGEGRVWVAEAVNYRQWDGRNPGKHFDAGDRIVVLEDTDGDGAADKSTVFVQDKDLTAPLGILVLEDRVLVSCSPHLYVYRDLDGDLQADSRETLLTGFGGFDHDHGLHSFVTHPDGTLLWSAGNAGPHLVEDKDGFQLRSGSSYNGGGPGNPGNRPGLVSDDGRIWTGGLIGRVDLDGGSLEVIAHNFRNNYEVAVDSFGDLYTEDNDDDGNRSCRTVALTEGGNYGYFSEDGARFWGADRRPGQETVTAHWHQDDPGVMPMGTINGAGGPTGVTVYEGDLIPGLTGVVLDADAGRSLVYTHRPRIEGAALVLDPGVLIEPVAGADGERGHWFRPSDVAVGPDGSIYVADWYDPGVGGHAAGDREAYGRIVRIAPEGSSGYGEVIPGLDSPNHALRSAAIRKVLSTRERDNPLLTAPPEMSDAALARRFWLWMQRGNSEQAKMLFDGLTHANPRVRITALRAVQARIGFKANMAEILSRDPSPFVRAHLAASLRDVAWEDCKEILMRIAAGFDGEDRTYLESVGIGADGKESAFYLALAEDAGSVAGETAGLSLQAQQELLPWAWRLHPPESLGFLTAFASEPQHPLALREQALSGIAFMPSSLAADAMATFALGGPEDQRELASWWLRHRATNLWSEFGLQGAVAGDLARAEEVWASPVLRKGGRAQLDLDMTDVEILWLVVDDAGDGKGCDWAAWVAPRILVGEEYVPLQELDWFEAETGWGEVNRDLNCMGGVIAVQGEDRLPGIGTHADSRIGFRLPQGTRQLLALCAPDDAGALQANSPTSIRFRVLVEKRKDLTGMRARQAQVLEGDAEVALAMVPDREGALFLIDAAAGGELSEVVMSAVDGALRGHEDLAIRALAEGKLPTMAGMAEETVIALTQVAELQGSVSRGRELFRGRGTCFACHSFDGLGGSIGPELSVIREKLGMDGLLESMVAPSSAIAFGYDSWTLSLKDGRKLMGAILADGDTIVLRDTAGLRQAIQAEDVLEREHHTVSLMPSAASLGLSPADLADIIAFLLEDPSATPTFEEAVDITPNASLDGWSFHLPEGTDPGSVWSVTDDILRCEGQPIGYLYTDELYTDFEIELDWRGDPAAGPGNSGVLLRVQEPHEVWPRSIEAQLHSGNAGDIWNIDAFPMLTVADRTEGRRTMKLFPSNEKPLGEWNHYRIRLVGGKLEMEVNGVIQNTANWCAQMPGAIALQSEGAVIEFRDIRVRRVVE
jgi:putative membrane-bound dehydrogenase-like protein